MAGSGPPAQYWQLATQQVSTKPKQVVIPLPGTNVNVGTPPASNPADQAAEAAAYAKRRKAKQQQGVESTAQISTGNLPQWLIDAMVRNAVNAVVPKSVQDQAAQVANAVNGWVGSPLPPTVPKYNPSNSSYATNTGVAAGAGATAGAVAPQPPGYVSTPPTNNTIGQQYFFGYGSQYPNYPAPAAPKITAPPLPPKVGGTTFPAKGNGYGRRNGGGGSNYNYSNSPASAWAALVSWSINQ